MTSEDLSGTHRKSALQLDVEALERRVVELERRLSEMAIEVVALTEENRVLNLRNAGLLNRIGDWQARDQMRISGYRMIEEESK